MSNKTNEREWTVYLHIVPKEITIYLHDKYYVGITKKGVENRWKCNGNGYKTQVFGHAIKKYGWENIKHEVLLEALTEDEAKFYERMYVEYYQSFNPFYGYNRTKGGDDHALAYKSILQYSLSGKFIRKYEGIQQAVKINGWKRISMTAEKSHGYQWRYASDYKRIPNNIPPVKSCPYGKEIEKYDLFGNFITSYETIMEASRQNNLYYLNLNSKRTVVSGEYQYKRADNNCKVKPITEDRNYIIAPVYCYSIDGDFICKFSTKKEALRQLGISKKTKVEKYEDYNIPSFVFYNVYNNIYKGYRWTYQYYKSLPPLVEVHYKEHPVIQLDEDFNLIDIYPTTKELWGKYRKNKDQKSHTDNISGVCRMNKERYLKNERLRKAYGFIWFRFIDIKRTDIYIPSSFLLEKYNIYQQVIDDIERRHCNVNN